MWKGRHWSYYNRCKKLWVRDLAWYIPARPRISQFRNIEIISYQPGRLFDADNHQGGCKPVIDAIKLLGWIRDDSVKWIRCAYDQKKVGDDGTTEAGTRFVFYEPGELGGQV